MSSVISAALIIALAWTIIKLDTTYQENTMSSWMGTLLQLTVTFPQVCHFNCMYYKSNRISSILGHIPGEGITVFHHDKTMETQIIPYCETEDCFKSELKYTRPLELIELVIDNSQHCEQMLDVSFLQYHVLFKSLSLLKMMCFFHP